MTHLELVMNPEIARMIVSRRADEVHAATTMARLARQGRVDRAQTAPVRAGERVGRAQSRLGRWTFRHWRAA